MITRKTLLKLAGLTVFLAAVTALCVIFSDELIAFWRFVTDRDRISELINSFGWGAPFAFICIQILQVVFAPVPGEATGFIGGYLFGAFKGFAYSSIALGIGSCLNLLIGRFLGKRYIRRMIPPAQLEKFDKILKRQGIIVIAIMFVFPGFPKDYLCLFLGLSTLPMRLLVILATLGRMPGTLMLSLQGAYLFDKMYAATAVIFLICVIAAFLGIYYRDNLYLWMEKINGR